MIGNPTFSHSVTRTDYNIEYSAVDAVRCYEHWHCATCDKHMTREGVQDHRGEWHWTNYSEEYTEYSTVGYDCLDMGLDHLRSTKDEATEKEFMEAFEAVQQAMARLVELEELIDG